MPSQDMSNQNKEQNNNKEDQETKQDLLAEYSEIILDHLAQGEIFSDIPLVKTGFSIRRLWLSVQERRFQNGLGLFLEEVRNHNASQADVLKVQEKFKDDEEYRERVLEHILTEIGRLDEEEKSVVLARLFVSFTKSKIEWKTFRALCTILERSHLLALECLKNQDQSTIGMVRLDQKNRQSSTGIRSNMQEAILLEASGLGFRPQIAASQDKNIILTELGRDMFVFGVHLMP